MSSIFDGRPKGAPHWPTFRGCPLHNPEKPLKEGSRVRDPSVDTIQRWDKMDQLQGMIYSALGSQMVCTTPNGGLGNGRRLDRYPTLSFERQFYVDEKASGKKKPIYLIGWIGGYEKGCIMHLGWQFPHAERFWAISLELAAFQHYEQIARILYDGREMDPEVKKFIDHVASS